MKTSPKKIASANPLKVVPKDPPEQKSHQSPYLKAILSSSLRNSYSSQHSSGIDANLAAALRYIANSR